MTTTRPTTSQLHARGLLTRLLFPSFVARHVPLRWHRRLGELFKFGLIGGFNTVVDFGLFNLLRSMGVGPLTSSTLALVAATTSAYFLNRHWTFKDRAKSGVGREYVLFFALNGVGLLIQLACLGFVYYVLRLDGFVAENVARVVGLVLGTMFRFVAYKKWVFVSPERAAARAAAKAAKAAKIPVSGPVSVRSPAGVGSGPAREAERERERVRARLPQSSPDDPDKRN